MATDIERILNISFNDEYNRLTSRKISTSEAENISIIFRNVNITIKSECLICSDENIECIKCFQCTAIYCKECLTKIASDFNKCSSCSIEIKSNYSRLTSYNIKYNLEQQNLNNVRNNTANNTITTTTTNNILSTINTNDKKIKYMEFIKYNQIYNIDFKNYIYNNNTNTNTSNNRNNNINKQDYKTKWDFDNKILLFYVVNNTNNEFLNINIKFNLLGAQFQAELYIWLNELLAFPRDIFKTKWNIIAQKINSHNINNDNARYKLINEIVEICNLS